MVKDAGCRSSGCRDRASEHCDDMEDAWLVGSLVELLVRNKIEPLSITEWMETSKPSKDVLKSDFLIVVHPEFQLPLSESE